ncbi:desulfoferrodoxin [Chloroflexota bacterium]
MAVEHCGEVYRCKICGNKVEVPSSKAGETNRGVLCLRPFYTWQSY